MIISLGDLLSFAEDICGYNWNTFHSMLENDHIIPYYENPLKDLYIGIGVDYGWSSNVSDVINQLCLYYPSESITINLSDH